MKKQSFFRSVCALAIPVALQSMLQASFGVVDQVMIGQLGGVEVAAVGLAGKFTGIYNVVVSAVGAVAGIMISQYMGQKNTAETRRSLVFNLRVCLILAALFTLAGVAVPERIMGLYIDDIVTAETAGRYLFIVSGTFLPAAGVTILSTHLRCMEKASLPLYAGIASAAVNTGLNWVLIFGKRAAGRTGSRRHGGGAGHADLAACLFRGHPCDVSEIPGESGERRSRSLCLETVPLHAATAFGQ